MDFMVFVPKRGEPSYAKYTLPFIQAYCTKHCYPLFVGDIGDPGRHPSWMKLLAHTKFNAKLILIMDLDFMPLPTAPPIFPILSSNRLAFAPNPTNSTLRRSLRRKGYPPRKMKWNCGLIGFPKRYSQLFVNVHMAADLKNEVYWEQGAINLAIFRRRRMIKVLDRAWNTMPKKHGLDFKAKPHFIHLAGLEDHKRVSTAQDIMAYFTKMGNL